MEQRDDIIVANPIWNYAWNDEKRESVGNIGNFWLSKGFSDQCYLINVEAFRGSIYNYNHSDSQRYPEYGGNSFERRVNSYMQTCGKFRITSKNVSYMSKNIGKKQILSEWLHLRHI